MLPFYVHFPSRYQFNASKVPVCTLVRGKQTPAIEAIKFLVVMINMCEYSIRNVPHITLLASMALMWGLDL
jgi:hypothetical protein